MRHIVTFSGGKDSLATLIWAQQNVGGGYESVFCDTGWEHEKTYAHIEQVEKFMGINIKRIKSEKYGDFRSMTLHKKRSASANNRFCTEELKVKPMIDYILSIEEDVIVYQGIRADESANRSKMKIQDEYFRYYFEPYKYNDKNKPVYYTYRRKDIIAHCDKYSVDVFRPIFLQTANDVFDIIKRFGLSPNPLYFDGFTRVGCFPCVMCRHAEVRLIAEKYPERIDLIRELENEMGEHGGTFFPLGYIPDYACSKTVEKDGRKIKVATIDDVVRYVTEQSGQLFQPSSCQSIYAICE